MTWTCSARRRRDKLGRAGTSIGRVWRDGWLQTDHFRNDPLHSCLQEADEEKAIAKRQKAIAEDGWSMKSQVGSTR